MELSVPLFRDLSLRIADQSEGAGGYPTARLQKGLLLLDQGQDLAEEGVGFGVPILKHGVLTVFPGDVDLAWRHEGPIWEVTAAFKMNLVERLAGPGGGRVRSRSLYAAKNALAALHRRCPPLRGFLTAVSNALRRRFSWVTTFEETQTYATLRVTYAIHAEEGRVGIAVDTTDLAKDGVTEVVMMNEQGAHHFDRYLDAEGISLCGEKIGTWDEVDAGTASFVCAAHGVAFSVGQVRGARLSRGRELIGSRLAWSGFGYSVPPSLSGLSYDVRIEKTP
jgi:hypothetical protein